MPGLTYCHYRRAAHHGIVERDGRTHLCAGFHDRPTLPMCRRAAIAYIVGAAMMPAATGRASNPAGRRSAYRRIRRLTPLPPDRQVARKSRRPGQDGAAPAGRNSVAASSPLPGLPGRWHSQPRRCPTENPGVPQPVGRGENAHTPPSAPAKPRARQKRTLPRNQTTSPVSELPRVASTRSACRLCRPSNVNAFSRECPRMPQVGLPCEAEAGRQGDAGHNHAGNNRRVGSAPGCRLHCRHCLCGLPRHWRRRACWGESCRRRPCALALPRCSSSSAVCLSSRDTQRVGPVRVRLRARGMGAGRRQRRAS